MQRAERHRENKIASELEEDKHRCMHAHPNPHRPQHEGEHRAAEGGDEGEKKAAVRIVGMRASGTELLGYGGGGGGDGGEGDVADGKGASMLVLESTGVLGYGLVIDGNEHHGSEEEGGSSTGTGTGMQVRVRGVTVRDCTGNGICVERSGITQAEGEGDGEEKGEANYSATH